MEKACALCLLLFFVPTFVIWMNHNCCDSQPTEKLLKKCPLMEEIDYSYIAALHFVCGIGA
jgi:hypothetical protein